MIGAGVAGLTTAVCLAEAGRQVVIQAAEPPGQTTSAVAGAIWGPHLVEDSDRVAEWCTSTLGTLTGLSGQPGTGVRLAGGVIATREADPDPGLPTELAGLGDGIQPCDAAGLPAGFDLPVCVQCGAPAKQSERLLRPGDQRRRSSSGLRSE